MTFKYLNKQMDNKINLNSSNKKYFLATKLETNNILSKQIENYFEDPNQYFKKNDKMIIGKIRNLANYDNSNQINLFSSSKFLDRNRSNLKNGNSKNLNNENQNNCPNSMISQRTNDKKLNYRYINDNEIDVMYYQRMISLKKNFTTIRSCDNFLKRKEEEKYQNCLPKTITKRLNSQEKCLECSENHIKKDKILSRNLSMKTNRSQENLIMSRTSENFRQKIENKSLIKPEAMYGENQWISCLRKPKNFSGTRTIYINAGNNYNPKWVVVRESKDPQLEIIRKPYGERSKLKTADTIKKSTDLKEDLLKTLHVKGTNLLNEEMIRVKSLKGRKIIFIKEQESPIKIEEKDYKNI